MASRNGNGKLRRSKLKNKDFPQVIIDVDSDFASIRLASGVEAKSYLKDGILFSEDAKGRVLEIQLLTLVTKAKRRSTKRGAA